MARFDSGVTFDSDDAFFDEDDEEEGVTKMAKTSRELKKKTVLEKIQAVDPIAAACAANPNVPNVATLVTGLVTAKTNLKTADDNWITADAAAKQATTARNAAEKAFDNALELLCVGIDGDTKGDAVKIETTGFKSYEPGAGSPVGELPAPTSAWATSGDKLGECDYHWNPVKGKTSYIVQYCTDPATEAGWKQFAVCTKSSITVTGLVSGQKYWFRVAAVGAAGQGAWSDPALAMAA
jgi:hypothetical protein